MIADLGLETSKKPVCNLRVDGKQIAENVVNRVISLTLTENRGFEADQLDIDLDDSDGMLQLPKRGAVINLALGWSGEALVDKGQFTVDEIEHTGAPDKLTLRARSADFRQTLNVGRDASYHEKTIGDIVNTVAVRNKLKVALGADMANIMIDHIDQTSESDGSFLTRLAKQVGAIATVKNGKLLFIRQGQAKTASGKAIPQAIVTRGSGDQHRFSLADRGAYTGVTAHWLNTKEPEKREQVSVRRKRKDDATEGKQGDYLMGTDSNVLVLGHTYATKANAERAAKAKWLQLQRGVAEFSITLAFGRADLYPEMPVKVSGYKPEIDGADWIISTITSNFGDSGFTSSLELEVKIDDIEMG